MTRVFPAGDLLGCGSTALFFRALCLSSVGCSSRFRLGRDGVATTQSESSGVIALASGSGDDSGVACRPEVTLLVRGVSVISGSKSEGARS